MRESFARRVATFLVLLLLAVVLLSQSGPLRMTWLLVSESHVVEEAVPPSVEEAVNRMLTAPVLDTADVQRLLEGDFSGPYRLGDAVMRDLTR